MTPPRFPLIEQLGLDVDWGRLNTEGRAHRGPSHWIRAEDLERVLEQAPTMSCQKNDLGFWRALESSKKNETYPLDTHTARLLCVQPIVKDTAESLLREFVDSDGVTMLKQFIERAKKVLEGK